MLASTPPISIISSINTVTLHSSHLIILHHLHVSQIGCDLPVQLWHIGPEDIDDRFREAIRGLNEKAREAFRAAQERAANSSTGTRNRASVRRTGKIELVDALTVSAPVTGDRLDRLYSASGTGGTSAGTGKGTSAFGGSTLLQGTGAFRLKAFALLSTTFDVAIFVDNDNFATRDLASLFSNPLYGRNGYLVWPDMLPSLVDPTIYGHLLGPKHSTPSLTAAQSTTAPSIDLSLADERRRSDCSGGDGDGDAFLFSYTYTALLASNIILLFVAVSTPHSTESAKVSLTRNVK